MNGGGRPPRPAWFHTTGRRIDARVHEPAGPARGSIVLSHPHPRHGGHMDHPVVRAAADRAVAAGLVVLRFDFGGVRSSEGDVDDRDGHQDELRTACAEAVALAPGGLRLGGGFSYGARAFARLVRPGPPRAPDLRGLLLLAPATRVPRSARDFGNLLLGRPLVETPLDEDTMDQLRALPIPAHVIVGEEDRVAPPDDLRAALPPRAVLDVLPGLSHFFSRHEGAGPLASDLLDPALDRALAALAPGA